MFQSLFDHHPRDPSLDMASDTYAQEIKKKNLAIYKPTGELHWIADEKQYKYKYVGQLTADKHHGEGWGQIFMQGCLDYEGEVKPLTCQRGTALAMSDGFGTLFEKGVGEMRGIYVQGQANGPLCIIDPVDKHVISSGIWKPSPVHNGSHSEGVATLYNSDNSICQRANMRFGKWHGYGQAVTETERIICYTECICEKGQILSGKRIYIDKKTKTELHMHGSAWLTNDKCLEGKELWFKSNGNIDLYPVSKGQSIFHASLNYNCFVPLSSFPRDDLFVISKFLNVEEVNNLCQVSKTMQHLMQPVLKRKCDALKKKQE